MGAFIRRMRSSFVTLDQPVLSAVEFRTTARKLLETAEGPGGVRMAWIASRASSMKPRIPAIRFRYGKEHADSSQSTGSPTQRTSSTNSPSTQRAVELEDIPARYRRRQMSPEEMSAINAGGPMNDAPPAAKPGKKSGA